MADSVSNEPIQLECAWTTPVTIAAAWALAKEAGGTLDYRLLTEEDVEFVVRFRAIRPIQTLQDGKPGPLVQPGENLTLLFHQHIDKCVRSTPEEQRGHDERLRGRRSA